MFSLLLTVHSWIRWLILLSLTASITDAALGLKKGRPFTGRDNALRHWTATIAHTQLLVGMIVYIKSPFLSFFFKYIHITLMMTSIILITLGSSLAKRRSIDKEKFRTMLTWFSIALIIIFIAIPWPFSPLASRPLIR
jgi:hypothetical protein